MNSKEFSQRDGVENSRGWEAVEINYKKKIKNSVNFIKYEISLNFNSFCSKNL